MIRHRREVCNYVETHWYSRLNLPIATIPATDQCEFNQCFPNKGIFTLQSVLYMHMLLPRMEQLSVTNDFIREIAETWLVSKLLTRLYLRY